MEQGLFISFEGMDGAGKSTCLKNVASELQALGYPVLITREPGGSELSEKIRQLILNEEMDAVTEALLFAASRNEHYHQVIQPALEQGIIVLSDRFLHSSLAYQGYGRNLGEKAVESLNDWFLKGERPDLVFYLDADDDVLEKRRNQRLDNNRLDQEKRDFYQRIRQGFEARKDEMICLDASKSEKEVVDQALEILRPYLESHG